MIPLNGSKTYIGAVLIALSALAPYIGIAPEAAHAIQLLGESIMGVGIGHKLQKAANKL